MNMNCPGIPNRGETNPREWKIESEEPRVQKRIQWQSTRNKRRESKLQPSQKDIVSGFWYRDDTSKTARFNEFISHGDIVESALWIRDVPRAYFSGSYCDFWFRGLLENVEPAKTLEDEFNELAEKWYRETRKISVADQIVMHPAYQKIIGMGRDALPFIFKELKRTRGHWLWALHMICRKDHAEPGQKFSQAVDSWLKWGQSQGYV